MLITQGDIYWIDLGDPQNSGPVSRHPHLVIQNNLFNCSRIHTVVVCAITFDLKRAKAPGNVLLEQGEVDLPQPGVINVSRIFTVEKNALKEKIGALSLSRIRQVLNGIQLVLEPREVKE